MRDNLRQSIESFAERHMSTRRGSIDYPCWENTWCDVGAHKLVKLRLLATDTTADIIVLSCSASYGASEDDWRGCNLGEAKSLEQVETLYWWLERSVL